MRFIDKLGVVKPPQDRYILLPRGWKLKKFLQFGKQKNVFPFAVESVFYRGVAFDNELQLLIKPIEKKYSEELLIERILKEFGEELDKIGKKYHLNWDNFSFGTYVPTRYGFTKIYTFPKTLSGDELIQAIELYIQEDISENFSGKEEDVVYTYDFLKSEKDEPHRVLAVVISSDVVSKFQSWAQSLGLKLDLISYEPICLINFGLSRNLPQPFTIIYTDLNKVLIVSFQKDKILYEEFSYILSPENLGEEMLNLIIWDIRNYIVLNDLDNIYLAGLIVEHKQLLENFLEKLPIIGVLSLDRLPERYTLLHTLGERMLNA